MGAYKFTCLFGVDGKMVESLVDIGAQTRYLVACESRDKFVPVQIDPSLLFA